MALTLKDQMLGAQSNQPDMGGNLQSIKAKMQALSGKAGGGGLGAPAQSNVQEASQLALGQAQGQQLAQQGQIAQTQLEQGAAQQQQQFEGQQQQLSEAALDFQHKQSLQTNELLANLDEARLKEGDRQETAKLELVKQGLRLQNDKYISRLNREAEVARLKDYYGQKEAIEKAVWGENFKTVVASLGWEESLADDDRAWREKIANIDLDSALALSRMEIQSAQTQAMASAASSAISTGIGAYVDSKKDGK